MGKNVHEKRKRLLTKMKAACLAVVMCVSTLPVLTAQIQPVTAYAHRVFARGCALLIDGMFLQQSLRTHNQVVY